MGGCILSKDKELKCPEQYENKKFTAVCMLFDEFDFMGNNIVSGEDLSQGQDEHINQFFTMRLNTINCIIDNHLKLKNNAKIAKLNENKLELSHYKEKLQIETTFL